MKTRTSKINSKKDKNGQNFEMKALTFTAVLLLAAFAIILLSSFFIPQMNIDDRPSGMFAPPRMMNPDARDELSGYFTARLLLSGANLLLAAYLLFTYVKDYLRYRTNFELGLIAFLFSFLLYALASFPLVHNLFGFGGIGGVFSFIPLLFSAVGLVIFVKLSNE